MLGRKSTALPTAYLVLRLFVILNWLSGAVILALVIATIAAKERTFSALGIRPTSAIAQFIVPLRAIAILGLFAVPLNDAILRRLLAMIDTVRRGDPFVAANAYRLDAIAWLLLTLQLLSILIGAVGKTISTARYPFHFDAGFSATGWVAVVMAFVLARVFAQGTLMRDDLEGTV